MMNNLYFIYLGTTILTTYALNKLFANKEKKRTADTFHYCGDFFSLFQNKVSFVSRP